MMAAIPVIIFWVALLQVCLGVELTTLASESDKIPCPGYCVEEHVCSMALKDTDCDNGLVCCVDQDQSTTEEYFTTEDVFSSTSEEVYDEQEAQVEEEADQVVGYSEEGADEENAYNYIYPEEPDQFTLRRTGNTINNCAGTCETNEYSHKCRYILDDEDACPPDYSCCFTEEEYNNLMALEDSYDEEEATELVKRSASSNECPGTCVHPSHAMFCEQVLPQFSCPLDSKCCIKRSIEQASKVVQCAGQCLPWHMHGYCFPPNELILGSTTCKRGTTCCMQRSLESHVQPPSIAAMQFPSTQYEAPSETSQVVMGHLAVDDDGTVFRVGTDGQVSPLPRVSRIDHLRAKYNKLMVYPRDGGHIVVYSDSTGALYQQFYPNMTYDPETPFGRKPSAKRSDQVGKQKPHIERPGIRKPTEEEFSLQGFEKMPEFQKERPIGKPTHFEEETSLQDLDAFPEEEREDIVIPDDDDEAPVVDSKPSVADGTTGRATCPGSCMSYFLRFTCFRGHAISDGFSCPGRSVCCARVTDIEINEKRLRSLSPYYKELTDSKAVPKCGIKGRKDSPHSVSAKESLPGEWCWQVAVINVQNQYMCGGALMGDSWVITAAHCVAGSMKDNQAIFVRAGVTDLKSPDDSMKGQTIRVFSTIIHHNFNTINLDNNIALLKLQRPVELNDNVCVVCLPISGQMPAGNVKCTVTGYGFVSKEGGMSLKIGEAQVPIIDDTECMANVTEALVNPFILPASSFCAGGEGQQDACQGDAGGPLICEINGHHELFGLVSWTLGCARSDVPSIYVKVSAFIGWINQVINSSSFLTALN